MPPARRKRLRAHRRQAAGNPRRSASTFFGVVARAPAVFALVLSLLIHATSAEAQPAAEPAGAVAMTPDDVQHTLPTFVRAQLERRQIAGAVVVVIRDDVVLLEQGYGFADMAARRAMTPDTPMRIGSITKLITALAVMRLVGEGRIALDDDVARYLDFEMAAAPNDAPVTLRRLLSHQAGFADRIGGIGTSGEPARLGAFLATRTQQRLQQDGDIVAYANYNAAVAARLVERISGQPFEEYVAEHLFAPLGMTRTTAVQPAPSSLQVSLGYVRAEEPPTRVSMAADPILEAGSTGVVASAADMARLLRALLVGAPGVISPQTLDQMMSPQAPVPLGFMGLGMYAPLGMGGNPFTGHDGGTGAFQSVVALLPRARLGLFASYNSDGVPEALSPTAELLRFVAARYVPDERFKGQSSTAITGTYGPTRRVDSSLFRLRQILQQVSIDATEDGFSIRPAFLPIGQALEPIAPGTFAWAGRDVAFIQTRSTPLLQIGAPPNLFRRIPWWENAGVVAPALAACLLAAIVTILAWPIQIARGNRREPSTARLRLIVRVVLVLYLVAWTLALLMVFAWWPDVALASSFVMPLTLTIYATAWAAVVLTLIAVWRAATVVRRMPLTRTALEVALVVVLVILGVGSIYWRVAGLTPAL